MGVVYRFGLIGADGSTMQGHMDGAPYTVAQALAWAIDDVRTGRARRLRIIERGRIVYGQVAITALTRLLDRLAALGGQWTGERSGWGSLEIMTPLGDPEKLVWMTPAARTRSRGSKDRRSSTGHMSSAFDVGCKIV